MNVYRQDCSNFENLENWGCMYLLVSVNCYHLLSVCEKKNGSQWGSAIFGPDDLHKTRICNKIPHVGDTTFQRDPNLSGTAGPSVPQPLPHPGSKYQVLENNLKRKPLFDKIFAALFCFSCAC